MASNKPKGFAVSLSLSVPHCWSPGPMGFVQFCKVVWHLLEEVGSVHPWVG